MGSIALEPKDKILDTEADMRVADTNERPEPSDGGFWAWIQCVTGFCVFFNTFGLLNSFGAFQEFYERESHLESSPSQISWIGTVQSCFIFIGSIYAGPLFDRGYLQSLVRTGSFMLVFGMFMTSLCTEYWQIMLAQGVTMGLGMGCLFTPATALIAQYFSKRQGLAIGIVSTGSTIGGIIYPIMFHRLTGPSGFGWATRAMAFIILGFTIPPILGMRVRVKPKSVRRIFDTAAWKEPQFTLYAIGFFMAYIGLYIPFFHVQVYCQEKLIVTGEFNFYLLPIMNAAGFFGRLGLGYLADRIGALNAFILSSTACGVLIFGWIGIESEAGIIVFCVLYGFFSSGLITLPATVIAKMLCPDIRQYGTRLTMQIVPAGIGLLVGNPIAGAILKDGGWIGLQAFSASCVIICALFSVATKFVARA